MLECFFGCRPLQGIDLEKPANEVQEMLVLASETLLQSRLLGNEDIDLEFFVITRRWFRLFLATALVLIIVASFLIDKTFASEEVRDETSFLHHILWDGSDDADHT